MKGKIQKTNEEWKKLLTSEEFHVLREKGTEKSFTGAHLNNKKHGVYLCAGCKNRLFSSNTKFDSGSGWPSFTAPISDDTVETRSDNSHGMNRTEVVCSRCGGHLGHVFDDGPRPAGMRYCINSVSLLFEETD